MSISQETILRQLNQTSSDIAKVFDRRYSAEIKDISKEMATSYELLNSLINREDRNALSDQDFQSAILFWTGLNTMLAGISLFRMGYNKEPQMLLRDAMEIFASAYEIHSDLNKYMELTQNPDRYDSTKSIKIVKTIHPVIGKFYGLLSDRFTHVSTMHTLPHHSEQPLVIGGLYDPKMQSSIIIGLSNFILTVDILNSILEISLIKYIDTLRFWKKTGDAVYEYIPDKEKFDKYIEKIESGIDTL